MCHVFGFGFGENEDVIEVHNDEREVSEYPIHCALKRSWRVHETKRHAGPLKETTMSDERSFVAIAWSNGNMIISVTQIQRRKVLLSSKATIESVDIWKRVQVSNRHTIELPVIDTHPPFQFITNLLLRDHQDRRCILGIRRTDKSSIQELVQLFIQFVLVFIGRFIRHEFEWLRSCFEVQLEVDPLYVAAICPFIRYLVAVRRDHGT